MVEEVGGGTSETRKRLAAEEADREEEKRLAAEQADKEDTSETHLRDTPPTHLRDTPDARPRRTKTQPRCSRDGPSSSASR